MSPRHLADAHLPDQVAALLEPTASPARCSPSRSPRARSCPTPSAPANVLRAAPRLASRLSIDDFGTGYSSLAYLRELAGHRGQDRQDVRHRTRARSERDLAIVKAAADLGHSLGLQVVAEGVEDETTAQLMTDSGCDLLQGFLLLPPSPAAELFAWRNGPRDWAGRVVELTPAPGRRTRSPTGDHPLVLPGAGAGVRRAPRHDLRGWAGCAGGTPGWSGSPWPTRSLVISVLPDSHGLSEAAHLGSYVLAGLFVLLNHRRWAPWSSASAACST